MLTYMADHIEDWINVGSRRTLMSVICVSGVVLAPFWLTLGGFLLIRYGLLLPNRFDLFWMPIAAGTAGILLLPFGHLSTRVLAAAIYVPLAAVLLLGFNLVVGCLLIGSCF
jgi:hypothetical protein